MTELDPRTLSSLMGLLAHDLRNPLSALESNVGYLSSALDPDDQDAQEALADALVSCDGLEAIIENMDVLALHLSGSMPPATEVFLLQPLVDRRVQDCQALATSHGVGLEYVFDAGPGCRVRSHQDMLGRAVANLVRNGIQHSPSNVPVRLAVSAAAGSVVLRVTDGGTALSDEYREAAFSAAGQSQTKTVAAGRYSRGLGMFCVATAARVAGARLEVAAPPAGARSAFELIVPAA